MAGDQSTRRSLIHGVFQVDEKLDAAIQLWDDYYRKVEEHDKSVCLGGSAIPSSFREVSLCGKNAKHQARIRDELATLFGIDKETMHKAKNICLLRMRPK